MKSIFLFAACLSIFTASAQESFRCGDVLTDPRDGKEYTTVQIGRQCWMAANLDAGIAVALSEQKSDGKIQKTCYGNDPAFCKIYGGLHTWDEAMQGATTENSRGICPAGWHIPSLSEWNELVSFLGEDSAGYRMKVRADHVPAWDGNNETGFSALPGGAAYRQRFHRINSWALLWTSTENGETRAWFAQLDKYWYPSPPKYLNLFLGDYYLKENGFSVRCIHNQ